MWILALIKNAFSQVITTFQTASDFVQIFFALRKLWFSQETTQSCLGSSSFAKFFSFESMGHKG